MMKNSGSNKALIVGFYTASLWLLRQLGSASRRRKETKRGAKGRRRYLGIKEKSGGAHLVVPSGPTPPTSNLSPVLLLLLLSAH